ncbi:hypothetical protein CPAR01_05721, partial [Colletotrichum paranaense]
LACPGLSSLLRPAVLPQSRLSPSLHPRHATLNPPVTAQAHWLAFHWPTHTSLSASRSKKHPKSGNSQCRQRSGISRIAMTAHDRRSAKTKLR